MLFLSFSVVFLSDEFGGRRFGGQVKTQKTWKKHNNIEKTQKNREHTQNNTKNEKKKHKTTHKHKKNTKKS